MENFDPKQLALKLLGATGIPGLSDLAGASSFAGDVSAPAPQPADMTGAADRPVDPTIGLMPPSRPPAMVAKPPMQHPSQAPQLNDTLKSLNSTPATNYDFYKNISAEDRMNLYRQMTQQQASPANLVAQGLGGLGDAISNSFGGQHNTFQKDVMAQGEKAKEGAVGAMDTQRQQKMQDMSANMEMQKNDPNSSLSQSMRKTFISAGVRVPSGMPASMMMQIAPALGDMAMKQAMLAETHSQHGMEHEVKEAGMREGANKVLADMGMTGRLANAFTPTGRRTMKNLEEIANGGSQPEAPAQASSNSSNPFADELARRRGTK